MRFESIINGVYVAESHISNGLGSHNGILRTGRACMPINMGHVSADGYCIYVTRRERDPKDYHIKWSYMIKYYIFYNAFTEFLIADLHD